MLNGSVQPGDVVAVVGAGPIGLSAIMGAHLFSPSHVVAIDLADSRLDAAKQFGADVTVNNGREDPLEVIRALTDGLGADVAIEAVGVPATFELATTLIRPGGHVANIGVHGQPATLHLEQLWTGTSRSPPVSSTRTRRRRCFVSSASQTRRRAVRHPPLRHARLHGRLRHVRPRRGHRCAEGHRHALTIAGRTGCPVGWGMHVMERPHRVERHLRGGGRPARQDRDRLSRGEQLSTYRAQSICGRGTAPES